MTHTATLELNGALIVFDGQPRLSWLRTAPTHWTPAHLWPDHRQRLQVAAHLQRKAPLLVVVSEPVTCIPVFEEELTHASHELKARVTVNDGFGDIHVQQLDWLPAALRRRGRRFLERSILERATTPPALRPPLLIDDLSPHDADAHVRFAHRSGTLGYSETAFMSVITHIFGNPVVTVQSTV
jgi:hypothetical protein